MKRTTPKWTARIASAIMRQHGTGPLSAADARNDDLRAARRRRRDQRGSARRGARTFHRAATPPGGGTASPRPWRATALEVEAAAAPCRAGGAHHRAPLDLSARV